VAVFWYFVHESGIHVTLAEVALAFTIPTHTRINAIEFSRKARALLDRFDRTETEDFLVLTSKGQQEALFALGHASEGVTAPILRLEHALHNFSAFVVMPLFAFANAGVRIGGSFQHAEIALGVLAGLILGKPLGITTAAVGCGEIWNCETSRGSLLAVSAWLRVAGRNRVHHVAVHRHARVRRSSAGERGKARYSRRLTSRRHSRHVHSQDHWAKERSNSRQLRSFFFHPVGVKNAREGSAEEISFPWNWRDGHGLGGGGAARTRLQSHWFG